MLNSILSRSRFFTTLATALVLLACGSDDDPGANEAGGGGDGPEGSGGTAKMNGGASGSGAPGGMGGDGGASGMGGVPPNGPPLVPGSTMDCEDPGASEGAQRIEAECGFGVTVGSCNGITGGQLGVELENADTTVGYIEGGDLLWYENISFDGADTLTVRYAKGVPGGSIEIRLDSPAGMLLGTLTPAETGAWTSWQELSVPLVGAAGTHTLYLVATGSTAGIINLDWIRLSQGPSASVSAFHLNQLGYDTLGPKHVVVEGTADLLRFSVVHSDGRILWCGDLVPESFTAWGSSASFYSIDFTGLTEPGNYRLVVDGTASDTFELGDRRLFAQTFPSVLAYFNGSRADDTDVWAADAAVPFFGGGGTVDARGGWYDASGDISKYLTHLSYANHMNPQQIPLVAWALAWVYDEGGAALADSGQARATQAEALWGADYLLRVLDPAGFFYTNVFDQWTGNLAAREICAFEGESGIKTAEWQSAMREGGGMSIAALARVAEWGVSGDFSPEQYLAGAEAAFAHLSESGAAYADDGQENIIDDYTGLLAAAELFAATENSVYLDAARSRAASLIARLDPKGLFIADGASRPFWHASDAGLPIVALVRYAEVETDEAERSRAIGAVESHLDYLLAVTGEVTNPYGYARQHTGSGTSFFISHVNETGYWWQGESARLASLAAAAVLGAGATGAGADRYLDLLRFAGHQMDWILGKNPYDICMLEGFGQNNPPEYCSAKPEHGTLAGGISNGITGSAADGSGIQWLSGAGATECWMDWRWVEQWLPHAAWYMVAVTALAR